MIVTSILKFFPFKGGVSLYNSPNFILGKQNLVYDMNFKCEFEEYVQESTITNPKIIYLPRKIDAIYLRLSNSMQEEHQVMDLQTGKVITLQKVNP